VRVKVTRPIQQFASGRSREPLSRENQGDLRVFGGKALETDQRLARRPYAHDAVVTRVAVAQLPLNVTQRTRVLVNGDEYGSRRPRAWLLVSGRSARSGVRRDFAYTFQGAIHPVPVVLVGGFPIPHLRGSPAVRAIFFGVV